MANAPRIMVTLPTPHDATAHMARVLHEEGMLGDYIVPLNASRWQLPGFIESKLNLEQWRYPIPAATGAGAHELLVAGAFRALSGRTWARGMGTLAAWRAEALDRFAIRRLKEGGFDAVYVLHGRSPRVIATAKRLGIPIMLFFNADPWGMKERLAAIAALAPEDETRREILAEIPAGAMESADRKMGSVRVFVVESSRMADVVRAQVPGATVAVAGQGVDADYFVPATRDYSARPLRVVQLSRVAYGKGVHITSAAVRMAAGDVESCTVAGWSELSVPRLVQASSNLQFAGGLTKGEVRALLQHSDVSVLPTFADPMPRAVLEAMACGLPVITTLDSGYGDIIEDGVNGFIVPVGDATAIATLLSRLAADPELRRRVGAAARATAEENTWDSFRERFRKALYAEILPSLGAAGGR